MKIVVTGSLGHISQPLTTELLQMGHSVTVISSNSDRSKQITAVGAKPAIGSVTDGAFLSKTMAGADAVYLMAPPFNFFDSSIDIAEYHRQLANNYLKAIQESGVKRVVHLSSIGAHLTKGTGIIAVHHAIEETLAQAPGDVTIITLRPVGFYYNLLAFIPVIKATGNISTNYHLDFAEPWVSPLDIATAAAEELTGHFSGRKIRYIASDELTSDQTARILGTAIGKADMKWVAVSDEELLQRFLGIGMSQQSAAGLVEMNASRRGGTLYKDYLLHRPKLGNVKLTDFAKDFATVYNS